MNYHQSPDKNHVIMSKYTYSESTQVMVNHTTQRRKILVRTQQDLYQQEYC